MCVTASLPHVRRHASGLAYSSRRARGEERGIMIDINEHFAATRPAEERGIADMARKLIASEILKAASETRALIASGADVLNLTVGDFNPKHFPIPPKLAEGVRTALEQGHTNYAPSNGMPE